jgi:hypothetical protein
MADPPVAVAGVSVIGALAANAAHEAHERVRAARHRHPRVPCPSLGADRLDTIEDGRLDGGREASRALLLVRSALVADRAAGVQRVHQDLGKACFGEAKLVGERRVAPGA